MGEDEELWTDRLDRTAVGLHYFYTSYFHSLSHECLYLQNVNTSTIAFQKNDRNCMSMHVYFSGVPLNSHIFEQNKTPLNLTS